MPKSHDMALIMTMKAPIHCNTTLSAADELWSAVMLETLIQNTFKVQPLEILLNVQLES